MTMENKAERFKIGDKVFFLAERYGSPFIHCGRVVSVHEMDELNTKYIVSGKTFTYELYDAKVFADPKDLIRDLCSVVIS